MVAEMIKKYFADIKETSEEIASSLRKLRIDKLIHELETNKPKKSVEVYTAGGWKARVFEISGKLLIGKVYPPQCPFGINAHWDLLGREIHNSPMFDIE